jgi:transcriptional regulator with XRE-family HTH domain
MTSQDLRRAREHAGWTQVEAAQRLGLTQAYLSMVEGGHRVVSAKLETKALAVLEFPATALPLKSDPASSLRSDGFQRHLGALGYPGFSYLRKGPKQNPAQLLFQALDQSDLDARVTEALPWLVLTYPEMDWEWLVNKAKLHDRQNRLGYVVAVANEVLQRRSEEEKAQAWRKYEVVLERSRLAMEDTLCHDSLTAAERTWLRQNRPPEAAHWNLLTDLKADHLAYAA